MCPDFFAAISIATFPAKTIRSAIDTFLFFLSKFFLIFSNTLITLSTFEILLICQSFCGCSLILAPLAPPRLSDPLKVEAEAHAVVTNCEMDNPDFKILFWGLGFSFSYPQFHLAPHSYPIK